MGIMSDKKRYNPNSAQVQNLLSLLDFPTHDFKNTIHQIGKSASFKENKQLREYQITGLN